MAVGSALSGGPKRKSRKKQHEVTPTNKAKYQTVSKKATSRSKGKSGTDFPLGQSSPLYSLESPPRRPRTRRSSEPCLASTPVRGSDTDKAPRFLESPVRVNQEATAQTTGVLTALKVFFFLLDVSPKTPLHSSDVDPVVSVQSLHTESQCSGPTLRTRGKRINYQQLTEASKWQTGAKANGKTSVAAAAGRQSKRLKSEDTKATAVQPRCRTRPRFNLEMSEEEEKGSFIAWTTCWQTFLYDWALQTH